MDGSDWALFPAGGVGLGHASRLSRKLPGTSSTFCASRPPCRSRVMLATGAAASRLNRASGPCAALSQNTGKSSGARAASVRSAAPSTGTWLMSGARVVTAVASALEAAEDQRAVGAAKPERVGQRGFDLHLARRVGHVVEIAVRIRRVIV